MGLKLPWYLDSIGCVLFVSVSIYTCWKLHAFQLLNVMKRVRQLDV